MKTCDVCYCESIASEWAYSCKCGVLICNDCFFDWAKNQIDSTDLAKKEWKCPQSEKSKITKCAEYKVEEMFDTIRATAFTIEKNREKIRKSPDEKSEEPKRSLKEMLIDLYDKLLDKLLVESEDVRKCPKENCKHAGFIENFDGGYINCNAEFECATCQHHWKDPL